MLIMIRAKFKRHYMGQLWAIRRKSDMGRKSLSGNTYLGHQGVASSGLGTSPMAVGAILNAISHTCTPVVPIIYNSQV